MLLWDLADPQELTGFTRRVQLELETNRFVLSQFLPNENLDDIEYRVVRGSLNQADVAPVRAWDTEAPIAKRQGLSRIMGELPPYSKKIPLSEEHRLRRRSLDRGGDNSEIINAIFDDAAQMTRAVAGRIEQLRGEALYRGRIDFNENGVTQAIDFGRSGTHSVTAGTAWSNTAASIVGDMRTWVTTYTNTNGVPPALALTSTKVINYLLLNAEIRTLAASMAGTPSLVTLDTARAVFTAFGLPPFVPYDVSVRVNGVSTRVIPDDRVILLPPAGEPLGRTLFGTTVESLELVSANQISVDDAPGMITVVEKTWDPVITWTKAAAIALPVLMNPDLTFVADVIP